MDERHPGGTEKQPRQPSPHLCDVRPAWESPKLSKLGDLRELTMGGTIGTGDSSGDPFIQQA
jgi:hypothetical protein